jgi:hypothetical protein
VARLIAVLAFVRIRWAFKPDSGIQLNCDRPDAIATSFWASNMTTISTGQPVTIPRGFSNIINMIPPISPLRLRFAVGVRPVIWQIRK